MAIQKLAYFWGYLAKKLTGNERYAILCPCAMFMPGVQAC